MRPTGYGSILSLVSDTAQGEYSTVGYAPEAYESALSNRKPLGATWADRQVGRPYRLASGPIPTPPGGYPIHRIHRQMVGDRIDSVGWVRMDPEPVGTRPGQDR